MPPSLDPDLTPIEPYHVPLLPDWNPPDEVLVADKAPAAILLRRGTGRKGARLGLVPWQSTPDHVIGEYGPGPHSFSLRDRGGRVLKELDDVLGEVEDDEAPAPVYDAIPEADFAQQYWRGKRGAPAGGEDLRSEVEDLREQLARLTAPPDPVEVLAGQVTDLVNALPAMIAGAVAERTPAALPAPPPDPREELRSTLATMRDFGVLPGGAEGSSRLTEIKEMVEMVALLKGLNGDSAGWEKGVADLPNAVRDVVLGLKYGPEWYDDEDDEDDQYDGDQVEDAGDGDQVEAPAPRKPRAERASSSGEFKLGDLREMLRFMPNERAVGFTLAEMVDAGTIQADFLGGAVLEHLVGALGDDDLADKGRKGARIARALIKKRAAKAAG